jgi:hypothetical protein
MHRIIPVLFLALIAGLLVSSCRRDKLLTDPSAKLAFSADTVYFDTVFTTIGSSTRQLRVYNPHDRTIKISNVRLAKGSASPYRINVDGVPGPHVKDIEILGNDSIFIFLEVTVNPLSSNSPLIITDSLLFEVNGKMQDVDIVAWGQNAHYHRPTHFYQGLPPFSIIGCDTTWTNNLPHVVYGYAVVDSACKLTIQAGTQIHFHNNSGLWVYKGGSIKVNGTKEQPVVFQGDRLEPYYREIPGQWDRIWLNEGSIDNEFNYAIIKNGLIGIQAETLERYMGNSLKLNNSWIRNMSRSGILSRYYHIRAGNTIISNCGMYATEITMGGDYIFNHCTFANYWRERTQRKTPSVVVANFYEDHTRKRFTAPLHRAEFNNSIIYGNLANEAAAFDIGQGVEFNYIYNNSLIKTDTTLNVSNTILNQDPQFRETSPEKNDFRLQENSPARKKGAPAFATGNLATDIEGKPRSATPDLGAYEFAP